MKRTKFLKTLLSALMAISAVSASAVPAVAEDAGSEDEEVLTFDFPEDEEEGEDEFIDESEVEVDEDYEEEGSAVGTGVIGFDASAAEVAVKADAPEGAFPEGTEMTAETVTDPEVIDLIKNAVGEDAEVLAAVDITFTNEGEVVQPDEAVKVALAANGITYSENLRIVHVDDKGEELTATVLDQKPIETEDGGVAFDADSFSIYAVVNTGDNVRLTVRFVGVAGFTEEITAFVKVSDISDTEKLNKIIYDPGVGELGDNQIFAGWTKEVEYTADTTAKTIEEIRSEVIGYIQNNTFTEEDNVVFTYYPMLFQVYNINFFDETNQIIVRNDSKKIRIGLDGKPIVTGGVEYVVNELYTPEAANENFKGWVATPVENVVEHKGAAYTAGTVIENGDTIKINGDINLQAKAPKGYWLSFRENAKGADFTHAQFIPTDTTDTTVTEKPSDPGRNGYTFGGWYEAEMTTDAEGKSIPLVGDDGNVVVDETKPFPANGDQGWGQKLDRDYVVYAKWVTNATADYTVIIWKQAVNGGHTVIDEETGEETYVKDYDFEKSFKLNASTNQPIPTSGTNSVSHDGSTVTDASGTTYTNYKVGGTEYSWTGFHGASDDAAGKTVNPNGTTVVNIYYERNEVELIFNKPTYTRVNNPSWNSQDRTYYSLVDGYYLRSRRLGNSSTVYYEAVRSQMKEDTTYYIYYGNYQSTRYQLTYSSSRNDWYFEVSSYWGTETHWISDLPTYYIFGVASSPYYEITEWTALYDYKGLYGSTLESNGYEWPNDYWWYSANTNGLAQGTRTTFMDAFLPTSESSVINFYGNKSAGAGTIIFYKQDSDNLNNYTVANTVYAGGGTFYLSDKYNGYECAEYSLDGNNWQQVGELKKDENGDWYYDADPETTAVDGVSYTTQLHIRFNLRSYRITYKDGAYRDGNDNYITDETICADAEGQSDLIHYGESIVDYGKDEEGNTLYKRPTKTGYVFTGWYLDDACTHKYEFTTMPLNGVTVYAGWRQVQYRVFIDPKVPESDTSLSWGGGQEMSFRVSYNGNVAEITGTRDAYRFIGLYLDENYTVAFNPTAMPLNDDKTNTVTEYYQNYAQTECTELDEHGKPIAGKETENSDAKNKRTWITQKLNLYAKWRAVLTGAKGINLVYDATDKGTGAPEDDQLYADMSPANAGAAATAKDESETFQYWVILNSDGSESNVHVFPGQQFEVSVNYAKVEEQPGSTEDEPIFKYTITLKAVYGPKEKETEIKIIYDKNAEDAEFDLNRAGNRTINEAGQVEEAVKINEKTTLLTESSISREGWEFWGWSFNPNASEPDKLSGTVLDGKTAINIAADLATRDPEGNDEDNTLYAVWGKNVVIRHSSAIGINNRAGKGNEFETIALPEHFTKANNTTAETVLDLTEHVYDGHLYGGYYKNDSSKTEIYDGQDGYWKGLTPYKFTETTTVDGESTTAEVTVRGDNIPVSKVVNSDTIFLKEVPDCYLKPRVQYYYSEYYDYFITDLFLMTAVDDTRYKTAGFTRLNANSEVVNEQTINYTYSKDSDPVLPAKSTNNKLYKSMQFKDIDGITTISAKDITKADNSYVNYVAFAPATGFGKTENLPYNNKVIKRYFDEIKFNYVPYYVTLDGVTVLGKYIRRMTTGDGYAGAELSPGGRATGIRLLVPDAERTDDASAYADPAE